MTDQTILERIRARAGSIGIGAYVGLLSLVVLATSGGIGLLLVTPWLFPSLGPTVMLIAGSPRHPSSRPLNAAVGHLVGIVAGAGCFYAFGLNGQPPAPVGGLTPAYVLAAALSVAITAFALQALKLPHPPAGATTLIISLGVIATPVGILTMAAAIAFTIAACWGVSLLLGERPAEEAAA
jgi:HPP family protein